MQMLVCFILMLKGKKRFQHAQRGILTAHCWKVSSTGVFCGDFAGFGTVWPPSASTSERDHHQDAKSNLATCEVCVLPMGKCERREGNKPAGAMQASVWRVCEGSTLAR